MNALVPRGPPRRINPREPYEAEPDPDVAPQIFSPMWRHWSSARYVLPQRGGTLDPDVVAVIAVADPRKVVTGGSTHT